MGRWVTDRLLVVLILMGLWRCRRRGDAGAFLNKEVTSMECESTAVLW